MNNIKLLEYEDKTCEAFTNVDEGIFAIDKILNDYDWDVEIDPYLAMKYFVSEEFEDDDEKERARMSYEWIAQYKDIMWMCRAALMYLTEAKKTLEYLVDANIVTDKE